MKKWLLGLAVVPLFAFGASSPANAQAASKVWKDVIKKCATGGLTGKGTVFLGLTSNYAPGTIFRLMNQQRTALDTTATSYITAENRARLVNVNPTISCEGKKLKKFKIGVEADLKAIVPATAGVDMSRARQVVLEPASVQLEELVLSEFDSYVASGAPDTVRTALLSKGRSVMIRAWRVNGLKTKLSFSKEDAARIKAEGVPLAANAGWTSETEISISTTEPFYIAGQLSTYQNGVLQAGERRRLVQLKYNPTLVPPTAE